VDHVVIRRGIEYFVVLAQNVEKGRLPGSGSYLPFSEARKTQHGSWEYPGFKRENVLQRATGNVLVVLVDDRELSSASWAMMSQKTQRSCIVIG